MTALYTPIWVVPRQYPAQWWQWKAHIDTGSPVTIAGSRLARDLLQPHVQNAGRPPPYERLRSATDHPLTVAPLDALVRVPLSVAMSADMSSAPRATASYAINMCVYAGIESESDEDDAGRRTITLKNWGDCDVLVGMDLLSQFMLTIQHGTIQFDPMTAAAPTGG